MVAYRISRVAGSDIEDILAWSQEHFGDAARNRYRALLRTAIETVAEDPERRGSDERPELGADVRTWHLQRSRGRSTETMVRNPRHFLIYRIEPDGVVTIGRVLHERMDLIQHVDEQTWT